MKDTVGNILFDSDFDSGNLAKVEKGEKCDNEFNLWTLPDCANTPYENGNRTWFYFSVKGPSNVTVKFNLMNLNRQAKLYSQGMRPLFKVIPNQINWERIKEKPITSVEEQAFILSFKFTMPSDENSTAYLAFCYPYSYSDLLRDLDLLDSRFASKDGNIFYKRELICRSLDEKNVDLLTITRNGDENNKDKPVVFVSARVHPGETPSSFVLKGFLNFILKEDDIRAQKLRENFIFLLVPMLNPDGVYRGHYRTDSRGVNLNRVYLETLPDVHPTIAATKKVLLQLTKEDLLVESNSMSSLEHQVKETLIMQTEDSICQDDSTAHWPTNFKDVGGPTSFAGLNFPIADIAVASSAILNTSILEGAEEADVSAQNFDVAPSTCSGATVPNKSSRLFAYIDLHGHASKRGIFIYGNHFKDPNQQVECLLFPKLISLNSQHFDFWACNFSEKNMRQRDKRDGLSKEGSGRVAVSKLTGITRSYTLECNYNTGRMRNILSPLPTDKFPLFHATTSDVKDEERLDGPTVTNRRRTVSAGPNLTDAFSPPVPYTEQSFEEVGEAMAVSLLDLIGANPLSRLPQSPYSDVDGVRQWIRLHCMGQRKFPFIGDAEDESSTGLSHQPPSSASKNELPQQVAVRRERLSSSSATDPIPSTSATGLSPGSKRSPAGNKTSLKSKATNRTRLPKPWPGSSPRLMKESLSQSSGSSPKSPALDFAPTSPTYQLFPKQVRSPLSGRRVPRKKSLKKTKQIIVKKEIIDGTIDGIVELDGSSLLVPSPSQTVKLLKRKRRKSRSLSESNTKEKRRTTSLESQETEDHIQPSTSRSNFQSKTILVKKKKILKKRNTANVLQKKKRMNIGDYVMDV